MKKQRENEIKERHEGKEEKGDIHKGKKRGIEERKQGKEE